MTKVLTIVALLLLPVISFAQKEIVLMGTMQHTDLEGGCWYLETAKEKYELTGSPELLKQCRVENRQLTVKVRLMPSMASTCMIGKGAEVVQVIDTVFHPHNPAFYKKNIRGTIRKTKDGCWYVLASDKRKYELQDPIPKKYKRVGARYNRYSTYVSGEEGNCHLNGMIINLTDATPQIQQKYHDPR